jgi:hypothetical protein
MTMRTLLILALLVLVPSVAHADVEGLNGLWRVTLLKDGDKRMPLKDHQLVLSFDSKAKTWRARATAPGSEQATQGTFSNKGSLVTLETTNGQRHPMYVAVTGDQLVLTPKDKPKIRLVALRIH